MRVLHLTTEFPPVIFGGLGTAVGGWVLAESRAGMTVSVLLVEGPLVLEGAEGAVGYGYGSAHARGADAASLPRADQPAQGVVGRDGVTFFQTSWGSADDRGVRLVERWRPDVVHLHTAMLWSVAKAIQATWRLPLVYHVHSVDRAEYEVGMEPNQWLAHSEAQEEAILAADRLIALSESEREYLCDYYPGVGSRVRVIGNGIAEAHDGGWRDREPTSSPLVLYSGRLVERKGVRDLLQAIPLVLALAPSTRFVLAGGPPGVTGEDLRAQWLGDTVAAAVGDRVRFTGWLAPDAVARWYGEADVLVVPSRYEPFGMVILEGMLHGLPVLAAGVGGPAEILDDGRTGLLFPPRHVPALADALVRLALDAGLRRRLGRAAAKEVRDRWTWGRQVERMRAVYQEVVRAHGPRAAAAGRA